MDSIKCEEIITEEEFDFEIKKEVDDTCCFEEIACENESSNDQDWRFTEEVLNEGNFICVDCGCSFENEYYLSAHLQEKHLGLRPQMNFSCPDLSLLTQDSAVEDSKFKCSECDYFDIVSEFKIDFEKTVTFCQAHNLILRTVKCPKCQGNCKLSIAKKVFKCNRSKTNKETKKRVFCNFTQTIFKETFFSKAKLPLWKSLGFVKLFCFKKLSLELFMGEISISKQTFTDWSNFCREVCISYAFNHSVKIGGHGCVVVIDEAKLGKRKYNIGCVMEGQWIFGGFEREAKKMFLVLVPNRSKECLLACIKEWILPGTTIISDCWKAFKTLNDEGYIHLSVNHSLNFVDRATMAHSQNIERCWPDVNSRVPKYRKKATFSLGHIAWIYFIKTFPDKKQRFHNFLLAIATQHPLH